MGRPQVDLTGLFASIRYAGKHKGSEFMSHAAAKRVGGGFDGRSPANG